MAIKIAILGWGSLLWEYHAEYDAQHQEWLSDGPGLKLEFSRVSVSRKQALTLVIDANNGVLCRVAYALSRREDPEDCICDLVLREGTKRNNIGFCFLDGSRQQSRDPGALETISSWARSKGIEVVVWTDLGSNFKSHSKCGQDFSVERALAHIAALGVVGKVKAAEYVWLAPEFVDTPLRKALQGLPWFL
ncbi:MAG: hypothetical protein MUQ25_00795 [Candidatus Aminicenantes bacterium]|nr:hypothetical protein [Candidatus Aminicenantes bacterium]